VDDNSGSTDRHYHHRGGIPSAAGEENVNLIIFLTGAPASDNNFLFFRSGRKGPRFVNAARIFCCEEGIGEKHLGRAETFCYTLIYRFHRRT
jgi:hypothetical protein